MKIQKLSGTFAAVGDVVTIMKPANQQQVALRLYQNTLEVAIFLATNSTDMAEQTVHEFQRFFVAVAADADLPPTFMKYIGAIGFVQADHSVIEAHVIEVSAPPPPIIVVDDTPPQA
jgi:hypothetical protein